MTDPIQDLSELMHEYGNDFFQPLDGRDTPIEELRGVLKKAGNGYSSVRDVGGSETGASLLKMLAIKVTR